MVHDSGRLNCVGLFPVEFGTTQAPSSSMVPLAARVWMVCMMLAIAASLVSKWSRCAINSWSVMGATRGLRGCLPDLYSRNVFDRRPRRRCYEVGAHSRWSVGPDTLRMASPIGYELHTLSLTLDTESFLLLYLLLRLRARCKAVWFWVSAAHLPRRIVGRKENKKATIPPQVASPLVLPTTRSTRGVFFIVFLEPL